MESLKIYQNFPLLVIIINFSLHFQTSLSRNQKKRSNSFWLINYFISHGSLICPSWTVRLRWGTLRWLKKSLNFNEWRISITYETFYTLNSISFRILSHLGVFELTSVPYGSYGTRVQGGGGYFWSTRQRFKKGLCMKVDSRQLFVQSRECGKIFF